jgi:5,10-methenyltetrahydrofolate synthetase
MEPKDS